MDKSKPVDRKDIINLTLDSITLLANANGSVNQTNWHIVEYETGALWCVWDGLIVGYLDVYG